MGHRCWWTGLLIAVVLSAVTSAGESTEVRGSPGRCAVCGRPGPCQQKVCRIESGVEKVKKSGWSVEAKDVCTMLPSHPSRVCDPGCDSCGSEGQQEIGCQGEVSCEAPCGGLLGWIRNLGRAQACPVPPQVGRTRSIKKLVKKEYDVEVPTYKTVVSYVCGECLAAQACGICAPPAEEGSAPSPSPADGKPEASTAPEKAASLMPAPAPVPEAEAVSLAPLPPM